jgi:hypothetical protein
MRINNANVLLVNLVVIGAFLMLRGRCERQVPERINASDG